MKEDYLKFTDNQKFVEWIFKPSPELQEYWNDYLDNNPDDREAFTVAKDILSHGS
ncbi:MAG: hypothetical protein MJB12_15225 [Firmicutes bacterium]|nr:hypothetical protein [Bacillota bacterium]